MLRAPVVNVEEKAGRRFCQVGSKETSVSEPLKTCRKFLDDVKTGGNFVNPGAVWEAPVYCPHGVRHGGGVTVLWALVRNVGTFAPRARTRKRKSWSCETAKEMRDGPSESACRRRFQTTSRGCRPKGHGRER